MEIGYKSHIGKHRTINQDAYLVLKEPNADIYILAVADGLGGHNAGEIASDTLIKKIKEKFENSELIDEGSIDEEKVIEHIKEINGLIYEMGNSDIDLNRMGTTLCLSIIIKNRAYIFHIGDSRVYVINEKEMIQMTKDHSLVEQLINEGEISREEAQVHPKRNVITRAVGTDKEVDVDFYSFDLKSDDKLLLCTDGLTNEVGLEEIKDIVNTYNCNEAAEELVKKANEYGGHDNITVIVFKSEVIL